MYYDTLKSELASSQWRAWVFLAGVVAPLRLLFEFTAQSFIGGVKVSSATDRRRIQLR